MSWRPVRLRRRREPVLDEAPAPPPAPATGPHVACNAPFSSMYLDQRGWVRACCMNDTFPLGTITEEPLSQIWRGARVARLRQAMAEDDLGHGCDICRWQVEEGHPELAFSRWFRDLPTTDLDPEWPRMLELSMSNTCNLQCAMCNGEWSSSIRSQREGLEPLPQVYDDAFFEDLAQILPHLERIKFLGGEPFLAGETLRVMEMIVDAGLTPRCHVTTNGTQWSPRVERILEMLPVDVAVSLDAATAETYESIRIGSRWETVQRNLDRFQEIARRRGTDVTVTFCLMTVNWHEFLDFCRAADERGVGCAVNVVTTPKDMSLYFLEPDALAEVVETLDAQAREHGGDLMLSATTFLDELDKLRAHLEARREGAQVAGIDSRTDPMVARARIRNAPDELAEELAALRAAHLPAGAPRLRLDRAGDVVQVDGDDVLGLAPSQVLGHPLERVTEVVGERFGVPLHSHVVTQADAGQVLEVAYPGERRMVVLFSPILGPDGEDVGRWIEPAWIEGDGPGAEDPGTEDPGPGDV